MKPGPTQPLPPVRRLRRCEGMTMLEVLVASVLLVLSIGSSIAALSAGMGYMRHARMVTLANQITQSAMEELRLANYSSISAYAAQAQPVNFDGIIAADNFASGFTSGMTVRVHFTTVTASAAGVLGKTRLTITTTWTENGITYTRKATSIFTEKGMSDYIYAGWSNI